MNPTSRFVTYATVLTCVAAVTHSQTLQRRGARGFVQESNAESLDFESLLTGTIPSQVFTPSGVGPVLVTGTNPLLGEVNAAVIFDSAHPTGNDPDLGTPNHDFGGPGMGQGGQAGSPYANMVPRGKILIVGQNLTDDNGDGLVDDPNDVAVVGSALELDFSALGYVTFHGVTVIDIETRFPPATIELFDGAGRTLFSTAMTIVGDNGVAEMTFKPVPHVARGVFTLDGSGAIDEVLFTPPTDARILGFVWDDLDKDGIQDPAEPGMVDIKVDLFDVSEGNAPIASTLTNDHGLFTFANLGAGDYEVAVDPESLPPGFRATLCGQGDNPAIDSNCIPAQVTLLGIEDVTDIDFGFTDDPDCDGRIGDFVFYDMNGNSLQDPGEPGLENAFMFLYDGNNVLVDTQTTGPDGHYLFTELCLDDYTVAVDISQVIPPPSIGILAPLGPSLCQVGFDNTVDSECGPRTVHLLTFLTPDIQPDTTIDWGFGDCGACSGGLNGLSLRYQGPFPAEVPADATEVQVTVVQLDGVVVFTGMVGLGEDFSFIGAGPSQTFGTFIRVQVAGQTEILLDTTCATGVQPGDTFPGLRVQAGSSSNGGFLCLPDDGG